MALAHAVFLFLLAATTVDCMSHCAKGTSTCNNETAPGDGVHICCPYVNGTCCTDGLHCCPSNDRCDVEGRFCLPMKVNRPWKLPMKPHEMLPLRSMVPLRQMDDDTVRCDDRSSCVGDSSSATCCSNPFVDADCCPLGNAVCCNDFLHCCPSGTRCNTARGECVGDGNRRLPFYKKTKAITSETAVVVVAAAIVSDNIRCPDNLTVCYDSDTCCPTGGGSYGCCPIPNAVCCSDLRNCCPNGMTCDSRTGACVRPNGQRFPGLPNLPTIFQEPTPPPSLPSPSTPEVDVVCPGGQFSCPDWMTCCISGDRKDVRQPEYSCCPLRDAVCCSDKKHCCPHGTICDLSRHVCVDADGDASTTAVLFSYKKAAAAAAPATAAAANMTAEANRLCPDHQTCPDTYTCCQLSSGAYGCCPYSSAVCCNDHIHCCPSGTVCDVQARGCRQENDVDVVPFGRLKF